MDKPSNELGWPVKSFAQKWGKLSKSLTLSLNGRNTFPLYLMA